MAEEETPLLGRRQSFVKFKNVNTNIEANLEHAVNDVYDALDGSFDEEELDEDALWLREQRHLNKSIHWSKRPSLFMLGLAVFLFSIGCLAGESSRQIIVFKLACNSIIRDGKLDYCDPASSEVIVSNLKGATVFSMGVVSLLAMTKVGVLSDQYGRKKFILILLITCLVGKSLKFYLLSHFDYLLFGWVVFLDAVACLAGGTITFMSLLNCYVSDIAEVHERSYYLGVATAFFYTGISIAPILGNLVLKFSEKIRHVGTAASASGFPSQSAFSAIQQYEYDPLRFELIILVLMVLFVAFVLPESRSEKARRKSRSLSVSRKTSERNLALLQNPNPTTKEKVFGIAKYLNFLSSLKLLWIPVEFKPITYTDGQFTRERMAVLLMVIVDASLTGITVCLSEVLMLYGILVLDWGASSIGYILAIACGSKALVLIVIAPTLNHYVYHKTFKFKVLKTQLDMLDFSSILIALLVDAVTMFILPMLRNSGAVFSLFAINSMTALASPALNSAIVKYYPDSKTGELFAAISLVKNLFTLTLPVAALKVYNISITKWDNPGFLFQFISCMIALMAVVIIVVKHLIGLHAKSQPQAFTRSNSFTHSRSGSINSTDSEAGPLQGSVLDNSKAKAILHSLHRKNSSFSNS